MRGSWHRSPLGDGALQGTQAAQIPGVGLTDSGSCCGQGGAVLTLDLCWGSGVPLRGFPSTPQHFEIVKYLR